MTDEEFYAEYTRLGHAIQTGVAFTMERDPHEAVAKHLRTGLNTVMCDLGSVGRLLIAKGVITQDEYFEAILEGLRQEVERYERSLSDGGGTKITLV